MATCECCLNKASHVVTCSRRHVVCVDCSARAGASGECFYCDPSKSQSPDAPDTPDARASAERRPCSTLRTLLRKTASHLLDALVINGFMLFFLFLGAIVCKCIVAASIAFTCGEKELPQWARFDDPSPLRWMLEGFATVLTLSLLYDACTGCDFVCRACRGHDRWQP